MAWGLLAIWCVLAIIAAALRVGHGKLTIKNVALCTLILICGAVCVVVPFCIGAFIALLRFARHN